MSGPDEVTGLDQCIAYAEHLTGEAGQQGPDGNEGYLRVHVQDALRSYDWIELHHWYSGTELTFTRQADSSVGVTRRQLTPHGAAPGGRR